MPNHLQPNLAKKMHKRLAGKVEEMIIKQYCLRQGITLAGQHAMINPPNFRFALCASRNATLGGKCSTTLVENITSN